MRLKAKDTLHVSSVKPDNIAPGEIFEIDDDFGRSLIERGLATEVKVAKSEPAPENKMAPEPANKVAAPTSRKSGK